MRNLLRFLQRYNFPVLFILFELLALLMLVRSNPIPNSRVFTAMQNINGFFFERTYGIRQYFDLKRENYILARENSRLRSLENQLFEVDENLDGFSYGKLEESSFIFTPARVINNSVNKQMNYITLDKGSLSGIQPDMAVVGSDGIVGVIRNVSAHYSTVIPVLNTKLKVSVLHKRSGYFGSLVWNGKNYREADVVEIPVHVQAQPGDTIVTSGFSALFPPGETVGIVTSAKEQGGGSFKTLNVKLSTDFKKLTRVYVVDNRGREERTQLEQMNDAE
jgi:rod shape-determining protein MreC